MTRPRHPHAISHALTVSEIDQVVAQGRCSESRDGEARIEFEPGASDAKPDASIDSAYLDEAVGMSTSA
jgi:hypothetical protein